MTTLLPPSVVCPPSHLQGSVRLPEPAASPQSAASPAAIPGCHQPVIKVLGLGGGGTNAVNRMIELGLTGVEYIAANTDRQALQTSLAPVKILLGPKRTRGLGAGGQPAVGMAAAEESYREIGAALHGADMVFLTAGMGGGTGTGSIAVAAKLSRLLGAVTIAIVTTPFAFEQGRRQKNAVEGLAALRPCTDTLIAIPNDRLLQIAPRNLALETAFRMADDVLRQAVQGITELITEPGMINVDFAHIRHVMKLGGGALMSIGHGEGENKAYQAIEQALHNPLLGAVSLENAAGLLVNFTSGDDLALFEIETALNYLQKQAGPQAEIVMGVVNDDRLQGRVQAILVVTGLGGASLEETLPGFKTAQPIPVANAPEHSLATAQPLDLPAAATATSANKLDLPAFLRRRIDA